MEPVIPKSTKWARENPEKHRAYGRAYYHRNVEECKAKAAAWKEANPEEAAAWRGQHRVKKYGLSPTEYEVLFDESAGVCSICVAPFSGTPHINHCHDTGVVRGLLCTHCNKGLGMFKDSVLNLQSAINYLNNPKRKR